MPNHFPNYSHLPNYSMSCNVFHKWVDGAWKILHTDEGSSQGCPLSPIIAAIVVVQLLKPIDQSLRQRALQRLETGILHDDNYGGRTHHPRSSRRRPFLIPTISTTWNPPWLLHKPRENKNTNLYQRHITYQAISITIMYT